MSFGYVRSIVLNYSELMEVHKLQIFKNFFLNQNLGNQLSLLANSNQWCVTILWETNCKLSRLYVDVLVSQLLVECKILVLVILNIRFTQVG